MRFALAVNHLAIASRAWHATQDKKNCVELGYIDLSLMLLLHSFNFRLAAQHLKPLTTLY